MRTFEEQRNNHCRTLPRDRLKMMLKLNGNIFINHGPYSGYP